MRGWGIARRRRESLRFSGRSLKEHDEFSRRQNAKSRPVTFSSCPGLVAAPFRAATLSRGQLARVLIGPGCLMGPGAAPRHLVPRRIIIGKNGNATSDEFKLPPKSTTPPGGI